MANAAYNLKVTDVYGNPLGFSLEYEGLHYRSVVNDVGYFELTFNAAAYPTTLFELDRRIEIWRAPAGRAERLVFVGFMRLYREEGSDYTYTRDYRTEQTVMYAGGKGTDAARVVPAPPVENTTALQSSALNRREGFVAFTNSDDTTVLNDKASEKLYEARYSEIYTPDVQKISALEYTLQWNLGDTLTIKSGQPVRVLLGGPDFMDILSRRIVAYKTGTAEAAKSDFADDMLKAYVAENLTTATDATRNLPTELGFSLQADLGLAPTVEHSATFGNLLQVCQEIAQKSAEAGTVLRFWPEPVLVNGIVQPFFRTQIERQGIDRTASLQLGTGELNMVAEIVAVEVTVDSLGNERIVVETDANR